MKAFSAMHDDRRPLILALAFLLLAVPVDVHPQSAGLAPAPGSLTVMHDGRATLLTPADLGKLPRHETRIVPEGSADSATLSGISLWDLLHAAGTPDRKSVV